MKSIIAVLITAFSVSSCVFEEPFEGKALIPVDAQLVGRWEEVPKEPAANPNVMLVLQNAENDYFVQYPVGEKGMYFRAYAVELANGCLAAHQLCVKRHEVRAATAPANHGRPQGDCMILNQTRVGKPVGLW